MKILLSSYSFGAWRGSEAGVGWNIAAELCKRGHEVTVITTSEFHELNKSALHETQLPIRLLEWDFKLQQFPQSATYRKWQTRLSPALKQLCQEEHFDIVHHITFNQYRHLKAVFTAGVPYVIGPVGGAECIASCFWSQLPWSMKAKEMLRRIPFDALPLSARARSSKQPGIILSSTPETYQRLIQTGVPQPQLQSIIAVHEADISSCAPTPQEPPYLIFDGGARPEKGPRLLMKALAQAWQQGACIPVKIAGVTEQHKPLLMAMMQEEKLAPEAIELLNFMPRNELQEIMKKAKGFISVGFRDAGCMALLEAVAIGLPCLCYDISGQHWLPHQYAIKLPIRPKHLVDDLAAGICQLINTPQHQKEWHQQRAQWLQSEMTWPARAAQFEALYQQILQNSPSV